MRQDLGGQMLNFQGEFTDRSLETEFFQQDMHKALRFVQFIGLMLGVLNTTFLLPDYFLIHNKHTFALVAAGRMLFLMLVLSLFVIKKFREESRWLAGWITICEIASVLLFLAIFVHYESPNYLIQAFGVMIILIAVFMVPNRWTHMVAASLTVSIGFTVISVLYVSNIKISELLAGTVYIGIVIILCSIFSYQHQCDKRLAFANNRELVRLSVTDHLSGAYNRAKLDSELKRWTAYSKRYDTPVSLIIIDFDDFKSINDIHGHLTGDDVIVESATIIRSSIRESDLFVRWGGEEFILLLPNTDRQQAVDMAERLRKKVADHPFKDVGRVTCSFGVVQYRCDDDIPSLLRKVDQMLYSAKSAGKNTVAS